MIDPVVVLMCVFAACMVLALMMAYLTNPIDPNGGRAFAMFKICTGALVALALIYKLT